MSVKKLKPVQIKVAGLIASGIPVSKAAEQAKCGRQSVYRWLKEDDSFIAYLNSLKNEQIESTRVLIQSATGVAVKTIISLMKSSVNDTVRLSAAKEVLSASCVFNDLPTRFNDDADNLRQQREIAGELKEMGLIEQGESTLSAIIEGRLSSKQGHSIMSALAAQAKLVETCGLLDRVAAIEAAMGTKK